MSKHLVFFVHGMGNFPTDWADEKIIKPFKELFGKYEYLKSRNYLDDFEFRAITYNNVFEEWRELWRADANSVISKMGNTGLPNLKFDSQAADDLIKLSNGASKEDFWRTHVLDVVMYRYLPQIAETVRRLIQVQILDYVTSVGNDIPKYSIVCHSLGTAVIYESFHAMITGKGGLAPEFLPVNVFMVANVVKPLWSRKGTCYPSEMGPSLDDKLGFCTRFLNFSHPLDPFSNFAKFDPPDASWFSPATKSAKTYLNVDLPRDDIQQVNVHSLEHYLSHPAVHVPMLGCLIGWTDKISKDEYRAELAKWQGNRLANSGEVQAKLTSYLLQKATTDFRDEIASLFGFRNMVLALGRQDGESN
jgi:hypothetical protein